METSTTMCIAKILKQRLFYLYACSSAAKQFRDVRQFKQTCSVFFLKYYPQTSEFIVRFLNGENLTLHKLSLVTFHFKQCCSSQNYHSADFRTLDR